MVAPPDKPQRSAQSQRSEWTQPATAEKAPIATADGGLRRTPEAELIPDPVTRPQSTQQPDLFDRPATETPSDEPLNARLAKVARQASMDPRDGIDL